MTVIDVDGRPFTFDEQWTPLQPERDTVYKTYCNWLFAVRTEKKPVEVWTRPVGQMVVDVIAVGKDELALIEMKDYRVGASVVPLHLADMAARKVRDTLAYMAACAVTLRGADGAQYQAALLSSTCTAYVDIEWPAPATPLAPPIVVQRSLLQQQLHRAFRHSGIVAHVVDAQTRQTWRP